jgi:cell fate regulator YaaT (PSP1 superfamily)
VSTGNAGNIRNIGNIGNIGDKTSHFNYKNYTDKDKLPDLYDTERLFTDPPPVMSTEDDDDKGEKIEIVGVRFKPVGKIYFFSPDNAQYSSDDRVIVETSRGLEMGYIVIPNKNVGMKKIVQPLKQILRKAVQEDIKRVEKNKNMAKEAIRIANERIRFHNLKMKLIEAEYTFDNSKLLYYFTAEGRVDFRELVKDLASIFKIRIELRQIGIRDQTKVLGGLSICGRPFCCNSFLQDFAQVTIKMAKEQNISINSAKISGACGRLMCCLKYEHDTYEYFGKDIPKVGAIVETSMNETGVVIESNVLTGMCRVKITQRNAGDSGDSNAVKPYFKKDLKIIGFMKNEREHMYGGSGGADDPDNHEIPEIPGISGISDDASISIDNASLIGIEDEPAGSAIDIEL